MKKWLKWLNIFSVPIQMLVVCAGYFIIEWISRHSATDAFQYMTQRPWVFLYNAFLIFTTTLIVYLVRRRVFMRILLAIFWMTLGIINGFLLTTRVTPFTGPDLHLITDAFKIVNKYLSPFFVGVVVILFGAIVIGMVFLFIKGPKFQGAMKYKWNIPLVLLGVALFAGSTRVALDKRILSNYFGNIAFAYQDYGYPYCLATTIFNTGIGCPRDYSETTIKTIENSESKLEQSSEKRPNILFLQLESFFDPELVNFLQVSEDPIPNFRKLMSEYTSGYFRVPSVGAGTANTEFETITGMNLRYFGPGEYPYKSILKENTCESAPYVLKSLGYTSHAIHNNEANFYSRKSVFANLGFDTFTSEEYMEEQNDKNPNGWVKDEILTRYIMESMQSTSGPDYVYTISVQGHGDYPEEPLINNPQITVTGGETQAVNNKWEYYVNQLHEMDQFIKQLTETLADYDEEVILVMYGDHLPTMDLTVKDLTNRYLFQTEYVMWDNMGLEKKNVNLASYQMAAEVMNRVGIHEGNIFRYHQARRKTKNYQVDLEMLQYDILYGEKYVYDGESPYEKTPLRLGIRDATIENIEKLSAESYYVTGTNFTPSAVVEVNEEILEATYISPSKLLLSDVQLKNGDKVDVAIRSNSPTKKPLTRTNEIIYMEPVANIPIPESVDTPIENPADDMESASEGDGISQEPPAD